MKLYLCYVYTPTYEVPHLVPLECESSDAIAAEVERLKKQWPHLTAAEVFEDDQPVWRIGSVPAPTSAPSA